MKIYTYATLKDYFDKEFILDEEVNSVKGLHQLLIQRNPAAAPVLTACRYAVKDSFVNEDFVLSKEDDIHIMPPSSGG